MLQFHIAIQAIIQFMCWFNCSEYDNIYIDFGENDLIDFMVWINF